MILQSLVECYEHLAKEHPESVAKRGWCSCLVSNFLDLNKDGRLVNIVPSEEKHGQRVLVPEQLKRSSGVAANLLCDNSSYLLGIDSKDNPERARKCFDDSKKRNVAFLEGIDSETAQAIIAFFNTWNPETALENEVVAAHIDTALNGGNLTFRVNGVEALSDEAIADAVSSLATAGSDGEVIMTCLATGVKAPIARLHPALKGVVGGQPTGTSLVGFNARAFESYGHENEQGLNAPVSIYATFAYTTALNYLLSNRQHYLRLGDTTIVYWADRDDERCSGIMASLMGGFFNDDNQENSPAETEQLVREILKKISEGKPVDEVNGEAKFYMIGLAPNAARVAVRFYFKDSFGAVLERCWRHYSRLQVVHAPGMKENLTPYQLINSVCNPNAKDSASFSVLAAALMRSVLEDCPYPVSLYEMALQRTWATVDDSERRTHKVTRERAAIIKAYLIKNRNRSKEEVTVSLNESRKDAPYVMGRLFRVLEHVQKEANRKSDAPGGKVVSTIKNRYFNSACSTPKTIFPVLLKLSDAHLKKVSRRNPGLAISLEKQMGILMDAIDVFPKSLSLDQQGDFILGYYHQREAQFGNTNSAEKEEV